MERIASFTCKTSELLSALKKMKPGVPKMRPDALKIVCELTVLAGKIQLILPGIEYFVNCSSTNGLCKAALPFLHFLQILKDHKKKEIEITIEPGSFQWDHKNSLDVNTSFFENDKILRSIDMTLNPSPKEIIKQMKRHTYEELEFNNQFCKVIHTVVSIEANVAKALKYLKIYGFTHGELRELVEKKINM